MNSLLTNPWLNIGMGLLANSGPSLTPVNPWKGIGQGLMAMNEAKAYEAQTAYEQQRMAVEQQKIAQDQQRQAQMRGLIQSLPPDQQQLAMADPESFFKARIEQQFAAPKDANLPSGWQMGADGQAMMIPGYQPEAPQAPTGVREYEYAVKNDGYAGTFTDYQRDMARAKATQVNLGGEKLPANYRWVDPQNPSAGVEAIPGGPATVPTEGQGLAGGFFDRMSTASEEIDKLEEDGYDPTTITHAAVPDMLAKPETQLYRQAQRDWVRAKLRKESGASISPKEMEDEIKTYFPQPNDAPKVVQQKRRARATAERAMFKQAGPAGEARPQAAAIPPPPPGAVIDQ